MLTSCCGVVAAEGSGILSAGSRRTTCRRVNRAVDGLAVLGNLVRIVHSLHGARRGTSVAAEASGVDENISLFVLGFLFRENFLLQEFESLAVEGVCVLSLGLGSFRDLVPGDVERFVASIHDAVEEEEI